MENAITRSATPNTRSDFGPSSLHRESDLNNKTGSSPSSNSSLFENDAITSDIPGSDQK